MHLKSILLPLALSAALPMTAAAQSAQSAQPAPEAADAVAAVRAIVRERYVLPETGEALDRALGEAQAAGAFAGLSGAALAEKVTAVMHEVTPDGHLSLSYNPAMAASFAQQPEAGAEDEGGVPPEYARIIHRTNGGVEKLEVLPGNVRYMDYTGFWWGPEAERALIAGAEFLRGGSAAIIDLRRNGGGSPDAVAALASYFLPAATPLMRFEMRGSTPTATETRAAPFSLAGMPVYVLTSRQTFSAAEEFAAHVDAYGFATLVGETTGGGGFRNDLEAIPGGLVLSVSTGQAIQAKTGKGWERTGIAPGIAVPVDRARDRALAEAMTRLAADASEDDRKTAQRLADYYRALADGAEPGRALADYVGTYGEREVALDRTGALTVRRAGRPAARLVAVGPDLFAPEPAPTQQFRFVAEGGRVTAVEIDSANGVQRVDRAGD